MSRFRTWRDDWFGSPDTWFTELIWPVVAIPATCGLLALAIWLYSALTYA